MKVQKGLKEYVYKMNAIKKITAQKNGTFVKASTGQAVRLLLARKLKKLKNELEKISKPKIEKKYQELLKKRSQRST